MRKAFRHTGVLMMMGVVALGLLGAGYTLWYENLKITATIDTATFDVDLSEEGIVPVASLDEGVTYKTAAELCAVLYPQGNCGENGAELGIVQSKLPTCSIAVSTDQALGNNDPGDKDNNLLTISMGNLYPYAGCKYKWDLHNSGEVPAHFSLTQLSFVGGPLVNGQAPWTQTVLTDDARCRTAAWVSAGWDPTVEDPGPQNLIPGFDPQTGLVNPPYPIPGIQLHAGQQLLCEVVVALDQADVENGSYTFMAWFTAHQWNEQPTVAP